MLYIVFTNVFMHTTVTANDINCLKRDSQAKQVTSKHGKRECYKIITDEESRTEERRAIFCKYGSITKRS